MKPPALQDVSIHRLHRLAQSRERQLELVVGPRLRVELPDSRLSDDFWKSLHRRAHRLEHGMAFE